MFKIVALNVISRYNIYMNSLRFLVVSVLFALPFFAFAQTSTTGSSYQDTINKLLEDQKKLLSQQSELQKNAVGSYLDVKINPQLPGPGASVRITIESYLTDLYKANITWSVDGKVIERGTGRSTFVFQNGPSGRTTTVSVYIITNTGEIVTRDFYFTPVGVNIMWEADTYTPPFYKGKALMVPQAMVRIVAVPDTIGSGSPLDAGKLVYTWKKDDHVDTASSGYGRNAFSFVGPKPLTNTKITLYVSSLDDSAESEIQVYLPQVRPFILFYEKYPLLGVIYSKPLGSEFTLNKKEFSVSAEPYFFSNERSDSPTIKYNWSVNGRDVQNYGRNITLRNDTGAKGTSAVSLAMRGITQTFQSANKDIKINFTESSSSARPIF